MSRGYAKCSAELLRFPLSGPTGGSGITAVDVIVVDLEDSNGATGTGFSYVLGGGGATVLATCGDLLDRFVAGQDCVPPPALWHRLAGSLNRLGRGIGYLAIAAIDVAAWDLHARRLDEPLGVALGGAARATNIESRCETGKLVRSPPRPDGPRPSPKRPHGLYVADFRGAFNGSFRYR